VNEDKGPLWRPVAVASTAATVVGVLGGVLTEIGPWYLTLRKPRWKPPDLAFGPAWTLIFSCAVASAVIAWRRAPTPRERKRLVGLFAVNGVLNVLWTVLFFRRKRPDWALIEDGVLVLSVAGLMAETWRYARPASLLLLPYLAWVSFAGALNYAIVRMNGPFK